MTTTYTKTERQHYNEMRARVCDQLGITKNQYNWLRRKGNALHRLYEFQCNGCDNNGWSSEKTQARWERQEEELYKQVHEYVNKLGLYVFFQTDPRGATIYLDDREIPDNNYTNSYCIY